jgi:hypothetical protein
VPVALDCRPHQLNDMDLVWKPSKRQEQFIELPDSIQEGFFGGAAGGGKSEVLLMLPIVMKFYLAPRFKGILFRRTFPELEKSLILRSETDGYYRGTGAEYNRQLRRWRWPSGAILDFGYVEYEQDVRKYDTTEYNYIGWDELTSFTEFQYIYITMSRLRSSDENLPTIARSASNPGNIGHGWVRGRFVEPAPYGTIIIDKKTRQKRIFIQSLPTDNPYLMKADPNYVLRLESLPEAEKRAKLYGDWWTFSGQVFDDWRLENLPDEPSNARHVIPAFQIPPYWPRILAIDWGYSAMTWCGWFAAAPTSRAYLYREYTCTKTKVAEWGATVGRLSQNDNLHDAVLDPSGFSNIGVDKTVAQQLSEASGINYRKADNDRLGGKILMQEYLRWKQRPPKFIPPEGFDSEHAAKLMRMKGPEEYAKYCEMFLPEEPETNLPKLQVFGTNPVEEHGTAPEFIKVIPLCVYNQDGSAKDKEDVAEFDGDDPYDGGRYGIKAIDRYFNLSKKNFVGVAAREKVLQSFNATHDYTALHRNMEKLERSEGRGKMPMRRYHRGMVHRPF